MHETNWHPHFCWKPVRLGSHDCRWLETVWRRRDYYFSQWYQEFRPTTSGWEYSDTKPEEA